MEKESTKKQFLIYKKDDKIALTISTSEANPAQTQYL